MTYKLIINIIYIKIYIDFEQAYQKKVLENPGFEVDRSVA